MSPPEGSNVWYKIVGPDSTLSSSRVLSWLRVLQHAAATSRARLLACMRLHMCTYARAPPTRYTCACTCVPTLVARFPRAFAYGADNLYIHNSMTILDPRLAVRGCSRETESGVGHRQTGLLQAAPPGARHPSQRRHTETSTLEV